MAFGQDDICGQEGNQGNHQGTGKNRAEHVPEADAAGAKREDFVVGGEIPDDHGACRQAAEGKGVEQELGDRQGDQLEDAFFTRMRWAISRIWFTKKMKKKKMKATARFAR